MSVEPQPMGIASLLEAAIGLDGSAPSATRVTILTDLSANLFAALLIILILLLQARAHGPKFSDAPSRPTAIDAAADLDARPHAPLRAGAIVELLRERGPGFAGLSVDLTGAGVRIADPEGAQAEHVAAADDAGLLEALGAIAPDGHIRLYVFDNRFYATLTRMLMARHLDWAEVSVPRALRDDTDSDAWSSAFRRLVARPVSLDAFRSGLARLLASSNHLSPDGRAQPKRAGSAAAPGSAFERPKLFDLSSLLHALAILIQVCCLAAGVAFVVIVELVAGDPALRYGAGTIEGRIRRQS